MTAPAAVEVPVTKKSPANKKATKKAKKSPAKKAASKKSPKWKKFVGQRKGVMVVGDKLKSRMVRVDVRFADILVARAKKAEQGVTEFTRDWATKLA